MTRRTLVLTLALALLAPASASAQWQPQTSLTGNAKLVFRPQVLSSGSGERVVGYGADGRFAWSHAFDGATFTTTRTTTTDVGARLLTYASERVMLFSQTARAIPSNLRVRFGSVGGGVGPVRTLAPGHDTLRYDPATNSKGDAVVAYIRLVRGTGGIIRKRQIGVVQRRAGGSFGGPAIIVGRGGPLSVAAAVGPRGEVVVAYEAGGQVLVRRREPGHSWSSPQRITYSAKGHTQLALAAGGDGSFVLATFSQALSEGGDNGPAEVRVARRSAGGHAFHSARLFETYSQRAPQEAGVRVALASDGTGVVGWTGRQDGHFVARVADAGGNVGRTVSSPASDAVLGGVAAGPGGAGAAVWSPPLDSSAPAQVFAAVRENEGAFGPPEAVGTPQREVTTPAVGIDPKTGRPLAAWVARTGQSTQAVLAALRSTA